MGAKTGPATDPAERQMLRRRQENSMNQANADGWDTGLLEEILYVRKDESVAVVMKDGYVTTSSGQRRPVITAKG